MLLSEAARGASQNVGNGATVCRCAPDVDSEDSLDSEAADVASLHVECGRCRVWHSGEFSFCSQANCIYPKRIIPERLGPDCFLCLAVACPECGVPHGWPCPYEYPEEHLQPGICSSTEQQQHPPQEPPPPPSPIGRLAPWPVRSL